MYQDVTETANQLVKAHEFFVSKNAPPESSVDTRTIMLYFEDARMVYKKYLDYEQRIVELQELLKREIQLTNKKYKTEENGMFERQALLDAIGLIKNNNYGTQIKSMR